jgi:hypothetical protein
MIRTHTLLLLAAVSLLACGGSERDPVTAARSGSVNDYEGVVLRVGRGEYWIGAGDEALPLKALERRLAALHQSSGDDRIRLLIYPQAESAHWGKAVNTAAKAGFVKLSRIHRYTDDQAFAAQRTWEVYPEEDLTKWGEKLRLSDIHSTPDTLPRWPDRP